MFGIGFWELCFLFLLALLVLGPERLPAIARRMGYWSGRARAVVHTLRMQVERELAATEAEARRATDLGGSEPTQNADEDAKQ